MGLRQAVLGDGSRGREEEVILSKLLQTSAFGRFFFTDYFFLCKKNT
jgi:hypothetical protein